MFPSKERRVAGHRPEGEGVVELVREDSLPIRGVLVHKDRGRDPTGMYPLHATARQLGRR